MLRNVYTRLENSKLKYLMFWLFVFIFSASNSSWFYSSTTELFTVYGIRSTMQVIIAFTTIDFLIPKLLNKQKKLAFTGALVLLLLFFYTVCMTILKYYLEPTYPATYINYVKRFSDQSLLSRLANFHEFISKSLYLLYPTFFLLVFKLYNEKQKLVKLNEQKKTSELLALKNQLNPHFLFNTLNNLHALAIKKSDDTSKVIEKLSNILDYILYRCSDDYVLLENEITLIENYLSLEKIRYGNRVKISFSKRVSGKEKIAPLLLLTFIENAFKHGVKEELSQAIVTINISKKNNELIFSVENSKPNNTASNNNRESIGLQNIKKQLELLYPKAYNLMIENKANSFKANLKLFKYEL